MNGETAWTRWSELATSKSPDALELLSLGAQFQSYFQAVEDEAIKLARGQGRSWDEVGQALGISRQAAWQRVQGTGARHSAGTLARFAAALKADPNRWFRSTVPFTPPS